MARGLPLWLRQTNLRERRALGAAFAGYAVDGFDFMTYTFIIPTLLSEWSITKAQAGAIATGALLTSAIGGWAAGVLADRFGRVRILQLTIVWFAVFACLSGFTHSFGELFFTRAMQGFGFGGEWSVGSVLIAETIDARHRGKAAGLVQSAWAVGWAGAAFAFWGVYAWVSPDWGWRILLWLCLLPALLVIFIRRHVAESPVHQQTRRHIEAGGASAHFLDIFRPPMLRVTVLASVLCTGMLGAYYSVTTWLPTFLKTERLLSVTGTSGYLLVLIAGSFAGYLTSAWLSDVLGRRRCFILFAAFGALLIVAYTEMPLSNAKMMFLGFPLGFFLSGIFSGIGAYLTELYPNEIRGSGQGFCYNFGRALGAAGPALIGASSDHSSLATAIGLITAGCFALVVLAAWALPETRGCALRGTAAAAGTVAAAST